LSPVFQSIFPLFLDFAVLVRDVFHGVCCDWMGILDPFSDLFWTVLFIIRGFVSLVGNVVFQVYAGFMCLVRMVGWVSSVRGHMCLAGLV
jgi:hypothetical protein